MAKLELSKVKKIELQQYIIKNLRKQIKKEEEIIGLHQEIRQFQQTIIELLENK